MAASAPLKLDLKLLRRRLGLSQSQLAELVGAHAMTVSRWERGVLRPSAHQERLLRSLNRASERATPLSRGSRRGDPTRMLADLLAQADAQPEIELGTLSATNRFPGQVVELTRGDIMSKVVVQITPDLRMGAVITTDSVDRLGLQVGSRAVAIIKATEVIVAGG